MSLDTEVIRVQLNYPLERVKEPILYHLVKDFGLAPNIRRANIDAQTGGYIYLELKGTKANLENGLKWLEEVGITISAIGLDGTQEWAI